MGQREARILASPPPASGGARPPRRPTAGLCMYEGVLSFVDASCFSDMDFSYDIE